MSLEYHLISAVQPSKPSTKKRITSSEPSPLQGLRFRFHTGIDRPNNDILPFFSWIGLNTYLSANWSWPNIRFEHEKQAIITKAFNQACRPLFLKENEILISLTEEHSQSGGVLEGRSSMEFQLKSHGPTDGPHHIGLFVKSRSHAHIIQNYIYHLIVDDTLISPRLPNGFVFGIRVDRGSPFKELKPHTSTFLGHILIPKLAEGEHFIRAIGACDPDQWTDLTPTYYDGSPEVKEVRKAWTGRFLSSELRITVGPDGEILEAQSR